MSDERWRLNSHKTHKIKIPGTRKREQLINKRSEYTQSKDKIVNKEKGIHWSKKSNRKYNFVSKSKFTLKATTQT